jgi:CRISPR-associated protein Cmr3
MTRIGLQLDPLDTLFFRDGRPFDAASRASSGLPAPQTLAGAVRTYLLARAGFDFAAFTRARQGNPAEDVRDVLVRLGAPRALVDLHFRGPWVALADGAGTVEPLLPVPSTLACEGEGDKWYRSDPLDGHVPGWPSMAGLRPLWRRAGPDAKRPDGLLTPGGVHAFLAGGCPTKDDWLTPDDVSGFDQRTGIEIDAGSLTAAEGRIYGIRLLALRPRVEREGPHRGKRVCLYAEALSTAAGPLEFPDPLPFGGEGRHVRVTLIKRPPTWAELEPVDGRTVWLLATPAFLSGPEALPAVPAPARLVAAASASPVAVSGWDVARGGPRPTRFAVPAGSVYFVEGPFTPPQQSLCTDPEDVAQGWGNVLRGTWNYA